MLVEPRYIRIQPMLHALARTPIVDCDHPSIVAFAAASTRGARNDVERAVRLYYEVRDGIRYDPYSLVMTVPGLRASATLDARRGWCVPKAVLLAACCRAQRIGARIGFADVRNHLSTERLRQLMGTDVFYWHGYTAIHLDGKWVKATPAFNIELCRRFRIRPLEFDGTEDSIYHPFDLEGRRHMEYLRFHGEYDDVPIDEITACFRQHYSGSMVQAQSGDFDRDVELETQDRPS